MITDDYLKAQGFTQRELLFLQHQKPVLYEKIKAIASELKDSQDLLCAPKRPVFDGKTSVARVTSHGRILKKYPSVAEAGRDVDCRPSAIFDCLRGFRATAGGSYWARCSPVKRCSDCGKVKEATHFYPRSVDKPHSLQSRCKPCSLEASKQSKKRKRNANI